jgi:hypothetical protein
MDKLYYRQYNRRYLVVNSEDICNINADVDDVHLAVKGKVKLVVVSEKEKNVKEFIKIKLCIQK